MDPETMTTKIPAGYSALHDSSKTMIRVGCLPDNLAPYTSVESYSDAILHAWAALVRTYERSFKTCFALVKAEPGDGGGEEHLREVMIVASWSRFSGELFPATCIAGSHEDLKQNKVNSCVVFGTNTHTFSQSYDYLLHVRTVGGKDRAELFIRKETVSETFGQVVWSTFDRLLGYQFANVKVSSFPDSLTATEKSFIESTLTKSEFGSAGNVLDLCSMPSKSSLTAVHAWDGILSYVELHNSSDIIAKRLVAMGVKRGDLVPFLFEKSVWVTIAVLSIIKAGAAFVPLGTSQPMERIKTILKNVNARVVVTSKAQQVRVSSLAEICVVDDSTTKIRECTVDDDFRQSLPRISAHDIACVLFTSGSTGTPKGMVLTHESIFTHIKAFSERMTFEKPRLLQFSAHTWDVFVIDIFTAWLHAGCVCIPSEPDCKTNPAAVARNLGIDVAIITPSVAKILEPADMPGLKCLIVGGEALDATVVERWSKACNVELVQMYGPAETGICIVGREGFSGGSPATLGTALSNSICLLIEPECPDKLASVGAIGELVVSSPSLASGYLGEPDKTEKAFILDRPWAAGLGLQGKTFYRTGDLLKYNVQSMDGAFDFVGRADSQVKYHGQRIEVGEIEHHLKEQSVVAECVVGVPKKGKHQDRLLAIVEEHSDDRDKSGESLRCLSIEDNCNAKLEDLRDCLSQSLPDYMLPNSALVVNAIPLTDSKKLDRKMALTFAESLDPEANGDEDEHASEHNRLGSGEKTALQISHLCAEIVHPNDIRLQARFKNQDFCLQDSGMDSVQIMSFAMRLQRELKVKIKHAILYSPSTSIRDLAKVIDGDLGSSLNDRSQADEICPWFEAERLERSTLLQGKQMDQGQSSMTILLTGGTGYLGLAVLRQLLLHENVVVYLVVRASSDADAKARVVKKLVDLGWWRSVYDAKLLVRTGDLSKPQLGLAQDMIDRLSGRCSIAAQNVRVVIHNGARVHYGMNYHDLKSENVSSTVELLKLAQGNTFLDRFVFVSGGQADLSRTQEQALSCPISSVEGYTSTKLVSEALIQLSATRKDLYDCDFRIVKPGFIIGDGDGGTARASDFIWRLVTSCVSIGAYNADENNRQVFLGGLHDVAEKIAASARLDRGESVTRVCDGMRLSSFWATVQEALGVKLEALCKEEWMARIRQDMKEKGERHGLFAFAHMIDTESLDLGAPTGLECTKSLDAVRLSLKDLVSEGHLLANGGRRHDSGIAGEVNGQVVDASSRRRDDKVVTD